MKKTFKYLLQGYHHVILYIPLLLEIKTLLKYTNHTAVMYYNQDIQLGKDGEREAHPGEVSEPSGREGFSFLSHTPTHPPEKPWAPTGRGTCSSMRTRPAHLGTIAADPEASAAGP